MFMNKLVSLLFQMSLVRKKLIFGFVLNTKKFNADEISLISKQFAINFRQDDYTILILAPGGQGEVDVAFKTAELNHSDFTPFKDCEYWRALLKILDGHIPSRYHYENRSVIWHYQPKMLLDHSGTVNFKPDDYVYIKWLEARAHSSILDIGCGSGALYHLLQKALPSIEYQGIDYSRAQIDNALVSQPDARFSVMDAGDIDQHYLKDYDAVHAWSVFAFMPKDKALHALEMIMASPAETFMTISCTRRSREFVPDEHISVRLGDDFLGNQNLAIDYYPYIEDLEKINLRNGNKYTFHVEEVEHGKQWHPSIPLDKFRSRYFGWFSRVLFRVCGKLFSKRYKYLRVKMFLTRDIGLFSALFKQYKDVGEKDFIEMLSK